MSSPPPLPLPSTTISSPTFSSPTTSPPLTPRSLPLSPTLSTISPPPPPSSRRFPSLSLSTPTSSSSASSLDPVDLHSLTPQVLSSRTGSVLSRGFILKSDARPTSPSPSSPSSSSSGLNLTGATNFRATELGIFGVAQPTETGLRSVLSLLRSQDREGGGGKKRGREVVWFCTREEPIVYLGDMPFVLRDAAHPTKTYSISDRAENLEEIEKRLKQDILKEASRYGGLILVQEEIRPEILQQSWINVSSVRTSREVFSHVAATGPYNLTFHRTPVTRDPIDMTDRYLDTYTKLLVKIPTTSALVFNCGIGVVRTTFAMSAALVVRRKQLLWAGQLDPFGLQATEGSVNGGKTNEEEQKAREALRKQREQKERDRSLLGLMQLLQESLATNGQTQVLSLLSSQPQLLENLRTAFIGSYDLILSLLSTLDTTSSLPSPKTLIDSILSLTSSHVNLLTSILSHRLKFASLALVQPSVSIDQRNKALSAMERYFFLVAFAAYVDSCDGEKEMEGLRFSEWFNARGEMRKMVGRLRKEGGGGVGGWEVFGPVGDLSRLAKGGGGEGGGGGVLRVEGGEKERKRWEEVRRGGGEVVGEEWARQIVANRSGIILRTGMILKSDQWSLAATSAAIDSTTTPTTANPSTSSSTTEVRGAINFRRVPNSSLYGLSQPTQDGIERVLELVRNGMGRKKIEVGDEGRQDGEEEEGEVVWINLREEPLIYINGTPYVLRKEAVSLRNVKSYSGISSTRLELLETRLKADVLSELTTFDSRLLLHSEATDGSVNPLWETISSPPSTNVLTLREIFDLVSKATVRGSLLRYHRVPITAEKSPDFSDVKEIVELVTKLPASGGGGEGGEGGGGREGAIVVNCQLGRGRSTRAMVIIMLVKRWLNGSGELGKAPKSTRYSYTVINNLLRTIRNGQEVKNAVDLAITECGSTFDLLEAIEESRLAAEDAEVGSKERKVRLNRGIQNLRAYYFLILFSSFLFTTRASTLSDLSSSDNPLSYEAYVKSRPEFKTIERELDHVGLEALTPLEKPVRGEGNALSDEVQEFVAGRQGRILSPFTLLKSDYFSGLQKMSLPERVEGAPNFRRVKLLFGGAGGSTTVPPTPTGSFMIDDSSSTTSSAAAAAAAPLVYGTGMPTVDGLRRALERMGANKKTKIVWTSMREEPVIYVSGGRPHVLRLFDVPLENVITTGVTAETVESMETALKQDLLAEASSNGGKVLLHDEVVESDGSFTITAKWEEVKAEDILTPREVFELMRKEGMQVDYERLPVTDEQAPIPGVYTRIEERVSTALRRKGEEERVEWVFNCQMGRGRTTTGMVAAALVYNILFHQTASFDMSASFLDPSSSLLPSAPIINEQPHSTSWDGRESDPYLSGEYKLVLQLVGVLPHGKLAKKLTDRAIDNCEGVQNLRKAIYQFKLITEACELSTPKYHANFTRAVNYLYRYGSLIVFAAYLLEKASVELESEEEEEEGGEGESGRLKPFKEWLRDRREVGQILSRKSLD